ncbi:MAG: asparagine synthase (glutamine-hydrolyzing) [Gemmatimonadaceae bacterium]
MCGIAGMVGVPSALGSVAVRSMVQALARRGPDGDGLHCWSAATLGHRRLAIFDLSSAGRQPMIDADAQVGISFNGAIYNFWALRRELEALGISFTSRTDTEVLLKGYRVWGIDDLVRRCHGMFAFALWDEQRSACYLVRDRLGVKPLTYAVRDGALAFASTARALRAAGLARDLDAQAIGEFLEYGFVSEQRSIFAAVRKVPPATILEWHSGGISLREYWKAPTPSEKEEGIAFEAAVADTERLLLAATERRLHADVPVGALLSGGVDSALVCWAIRASGGEVAAFTVGVPGSPADESRLAARCAARLGIRHRVLALSDEEPADLDELVSAYAEPFAVPSALGMLRVSRAVAQAEVKVLLTGDGGDDVFLGYPRHLMLARGERAAAVLPPAATAAWRAVRQLVPDVGPLRRGKHLIDYVAGGLGAFVSANDGLPEMRSLGLLGPKLAEVTVPARRMAWSVAGARRVLRDYLAYDVRMQFVGEYLTKVDGATMHYALEARSPFFDHPLWEYAAQLPVATRLQGGRLKAILREIARRRIGDFVANEPKRGFTIPVEAWVLGRWRDSVVRAFQSSALHDEGWIDADAVRRLTATARDARAGRMLWHLLVLERWLRSERA